MSSISKLICIYLLIQVALTACASGTYDQFLWWQSEGRENQQISESVPSVVDSAPVSQAASDLRFADSWVSPPPAPSAQKAQLDAYQVSGESGAKASIVFRLSRPAQYLLRQSPAGEHNLTIRNTALSFNAAASWVAPHGSDAPLVLVRPGISGEDVQMKLVTKPGAALQAEQKQGDIVLAVVAPEPAKPVPLRKNVEVRARMNPVAIPVPQVEADVRQEPEQTETLRGLTLGSTNDGQSLLSLNLDKPVKHEIKGLGEGEYQLRLFNIKLAPEAFRTLVSSSSGSALRIYSARPEQQGADVLVHIFSSRDARLKVSLNGQKLQVMAGAEGL